MNEKQALEYLCRDGGSVPCSRYGYDSESCASVAYAVALIVADSSGDDVTTDLLDSIMSLVVNDHDDPETLILSHGESLNLNPRDLLDYLPDTPDMESDVFISEVRDGYSVSAEGRYLKTLASREEAKSFLWEWSRDNYFYGETWFVNERGNTELLVRTDNPEEPYKSVEVGYV